MILANGLLQSGIITNKIDIFSNDLNEIVETQMIDSFMFFDIAQQNVPICYIEYFKKRDRYELHWETFEEYRKCGYMTEALLAFEQWMQTNTKEDQLWALISHGNTPSIKTAHRCGFVETDENSEGTKWYKVALNRSMQQGLEGT